MNQLEASGNSVKLDGFDCPTLDEIISLWRSYRSSGLPAEEAWEAIAAGLTLDMVFSGHARARRVEQ